MSEYSTWERPFAPLDPVIASVAATWFDLPYEDRMCAEMPVGLLVGEQPGPSSNPRLPLWPYPPRSAGGRLHAMSAIPMGEYLARLARVNLTQRPTARWDVDLVRPRLIRLLDGLPDSARAVLVGARARDAYNHGQDVQINWFDREAWSNGAVGHLIGVTAIPHPSGRNQAYNGPATAAATGEAVRWAADWEQQ